MNYRSMSLSSGVKQISKPESSLYCNQSCWTEQTNKARITDRVWSVLLTLYSVFVDLSAKRAAKRSKRMSWPCLDKGGKWVQHWCIPRTGYQGDDLGTGCFVCTRMCVCSSPQTCFVFSFESRNLPYVRDECSEFTSFLSVYCGTTRTRLVCPWNHKHTQPRDVIN